MAERFLQKTHEEEEQEVVPKKKQTIKVKAGRMGGENVDLELDKGSTLQDVVTHMKFTGLEVRLNKSNSPLTTQLKEGDVVVAVPEAIVGG